MDTRVKPTYDAECVVHTLAYGFTVKQPTILLLMVRSIA
jgi:hypothetical protein